MRNQEQEQEIEECRECGTEFNLAAQYYYDNLCPSCKEVDGSSGGRSSHSGSESEIHDQEQDPGSTAVPCTVCQDSVPPEEIQYAQYVGRGPSERVPVCSDDCASRAETPPWAPRGPA